MERKLASIQVIRELLPIEGADMIELAKVNDWQVVVKKGEFAVDEECVYIEVDSFMPDRSEFEFLKPRGMRVRTIKLRQQLSQGLCFPLSILPPEFLCTKDFHEEWEGTDVTEILGIIKYEPAIPACLAGKVRGNFPSFISKTDEERIQNLTKHFDRYKQSKFYVTEKLDGSSCTIYLKDGVFGVCSRNMDLLESENNSFWKVVRSLEIECKLRSIGLDNIALQGELIGEGIQGNPYKLQGQTLRLFNVFDINAQIYYDFNRYCEMCHILQITSVPILDADFTLPNTIAELLVMAEGKSVLHAEAEREGFVIRSYDRTISFKVISNKFLLKEK